MDNLSDRPDALARASMYARMLRNCEDPTEALTATCVHFDCTADSDPAVALARLASANAARHAAIFAFLKTQTRRRLVNRTIPEAPDRSLTNPEATRLSKLVEDSQSSATVLFPGAPMYRIIAREVSILPESLLELPSGTRLLLTYPLRVPMLFPMYSDTDFTAVCGTIATAYELIFSERTAEVRGHDLSDLYIEEVHFFAGERLVHPVIGS